MSSATSEVLSLRRRELFDLPSANTDPAIAERERARRTDPRHQAPERNALWRAGAGAGKTFNLVRRVLRLTDEFRRREGREPRLVITTFTRKATQELRERLVTAALQEAPDLLAFVTSRSQLQLSTLHGVMEQFLRRHGLPLGLDPAFRLGTAEEIEILARQALRVLMAKPEFQDSSSLWFEKRGFRATLKLLRRVSQIELEDPTAGPASPELLRRLLQDSEQSEIRQLHDWSAFLQRSHADWRETADRIEAACAIWSEAHVSLEQHRVLQKRTELIEGLRQIAEAKPRNQGARKLELPEGWDLKIFTELADRLSQTQAEIEAWESGVHDQIQLRDLARGFQSEFFHFKQRKGWLEVEDLELLALSLAREFPDAGRDFSETWDFWLIDEYQDTSPRQVKLIEALAGDRPVFVVGDPQQSIYAFRGARPHVFQDRETLARREAHELELLDQNRRSHPDLLSFINRAVAGLNREPNREQNCGNGGMAARGMAPGFQPMRPLEDLRQKDQSSLTLGLQSLGRAVLFRGGWQGNESATGQVPRRKGPSAAEALQLEAGEIAQAVQLRLSDGAKPQDCAVLGRTNSELSAVARELRRRGIPHQLYTSGAFAEREEIQDLCALLIFLENPHDDANLIHLARTPWLPVCESVLADASERKSSLWLALQSRSELAVLRQLQDNAVSLGWTAAFHRALTGTRFWEWCRELDPTGRREANAFKLIAQLARAERQPGFLPSRFVEEVLGSEGAESENADRDAAGSVEPNRVALMTVHASKGLEFDHVFMGFLAKAGKSERVNNEFCYHEEAASWWAGLPDEEENLSTGVLGRHWRDVFNTWLNDENRRVLYVALTRAKSSLFLSARGEWHDDALIRLLGADHWTDADDLRILQELPSAKEWTSNARSEPQVRPSWANTPSSFRADAKTVEGGRTLLKSVSVTLLVETLSNSQSAMRAGSDIVSGEVRGSEAAVEQIAERARMAALGTRVHALLEMLQRWSRANLQSDPRAWREIMKEEMRRWFPERETEVLQALDWLVEARDFPFEALLRFGEVEWGFALRVADSVIEGQIDLWGALPSKGDGPGSEIWIADYKTGSLASREKALRQLKIYACAVGASLNLDDDQAIRLVPIYLFERQLKAESVRLGDLRAELKASLQGLQGKG